MQYRSRHRSSRYGRSPRGGATDYLMPFVILIALGIILVLIFNLWKAIFSDENPEGVYMHIVEGSAQLRTWGTDDFFDLSADALVVQGDEIRTSSEGRVIFEFFDGTIMRIDGGSNVIFEIVEEGKDGPELKIILVDGRAWFNKVYKDTANTSLVVTMNNVVITSDSSHVFELENEFDEAVRVLNGSDLQVDILSQEDKKIVETERLGVGQEIVFTDKVLETFWEFQSPTVIAPLSDTFKQSDWYLWNVDQDENPDEINKSISDPNNSLVQAPPELLESDEEEENEDESEEDEEDSEVVEEEDEVVDEVPEQSGSLSKPTVTSVAGIPNPDSNGVYQTKSRVTTLAGSVPAGTAQVIVNDYTLSQFAAGSTTWTYYANADFGLLVPGENTFTVYAVDSEGFKSEPLVFKVFYTAQTPVATPDPEPTPEPDAETTTPGEDAVVVPEESTEGV